MPPEDRHETVEIGGIGRTSPERPGRKPLQHAADVLFGRGFRHAGLVDGRHGEEFGQRCRRRLVRIERPFGLDPVDPDGDGWPYAVLAVSVEEKSVCF